MNEDAFQSVRRDGSAAQSALDALADINITNEDGMTLLHAAIAFGNNHVIPTLLRRGIDVNAQDMRGQTPLHYAVTHHNRNAVESILAHGGDVSLADRHGNTPVWTAVFNARGRYDILEVILNHGGRTLVREKNKHGRSPVDFAMQINDTTVLSMMQE